MLLPLSLTQEWLANNMPSILTMAYINVNSSTLAILKFSLGKTGTPNHL
jgi:hypothetical protein